MEFKGQNIGKTIAEVIASNGDANFLNGLWYDWFTKNTPPVRAQKGLFTALVKFCKVYNIDTTTHYCFFKNESSGKNAFKICNCKTKDVEFYVVKEEYAGKRAWWVYSRETAFSAPLASSILINKKGV